MPTAAQTKPFKSYEEQIALLRARGLLIQDTAYAQEVLKRLNYYRLSAYSLTLRKEDRFYPGVTFEDIVELYDFDDELRRILFRFSSAVETSARAYCAYYHAKVHGPLGYLNNRWFEDEWKHAGFLRELDTAIRHSSDAFIIHHREDLGGVYPVWVAMEETTFGSLSKFYKNMLAADRQAIAKNFYGLPRAYVENYMQCASVARNIAAHGGRFYNRIHLKPSVKLPEGLKAKMDADAPAAYMYAIYALLPDSSKYAMIRELQKAFDRYPFAMPKYLGLPAGWEKLYSLYGNHLQAEH